MQYLVSQKPKPKYKGGLMTIIMVVEAKTAKEALAQAVERGAKHSEKWFSEAPDYNKPKVEALQVGVYYGF